MLEICFDSTTCANLQKLKTLNILPSNSDITFLPDNYTIGSLASLEPSKRIVALFEAGIVVNRTWLTTSYADFKKALKKAENVRIWMSHTSFEYVNFLVTCKLLYERKIQNVLICENFYKEYEKRFFGLLDDYELVLILNECKKIDINIYKRQWEDIFLSQKPLRLVKNNELIFGDYDMFDKSILQLLSQMSDSYEIEYALDLKLFQEGLTIPDPSFIINRITYLKNK